MGQARQVQAHRRQGLGATGKLPVLPDDARRRTCSDHGRPSVVVSEVRERAVPEDRGAYEFSEQEARAKRVGLWSDPDPVRLGSGGVDAG